MRQKVFLFYHFYNCSTARFPLFLLIFTPDGAPLWGPLLGSDSVSHQSPCLTPALLNAAHVAEQGWADVAWAYSPPHLLYGCPIFPTDLISRGRLCFCLVFITPPPHLLQSVSKVNIGLSHH